MARTSRFVWGGRIMHKGRQRRVVFAGAARDFCELAFGGPSTNRGYIATTWNTDEVAAARARPGVVLVQTNKEYSRTPTFVPLEAVFRK